MKFCYPSCERNKPRKANFLINILLRNGLQSFLSQINYVEDFGFYPASYYADIPILFPYP
jgi:hypothetical protein